MPLLSNDEVATRLSQLEGWEGDNSSISKSYQFATFMDGINFVTRVANIAEYNNHHPDIDIRWRTVKIVLSTHSEGGVTEKDIHLAKEIEKAATES